MCIRKLFLSINFTCVYNVVKERKKLNFLVKNTFSQLIPDIRLVPLQMNFITINLIMKYDCHSNHKPVESQLSQNQLSLSHNCVTIGLQYFLGNMMDITYCNQDHVWVHPSL